MAQVGERALQDRELRGENRRVDLRRSHVAEPEELALQARRSLVRS